MGAPKPFGAPVLFAQNRSSLLAGDEGEEEKTRCMQWAWSGS